jgi:hypothetical protein
MCGLFHQLSDILKLGSDKHGREQRIDSHEKRVSFSLRGLEKLHTEGMW